MIKQRTANIQTEEERRIIGRLFGIVLPEYIRQRNEVRVAVSNAKKLGLLGLVNSKVIRWFEKEKLL